MNNGNIQFVGRKDNQIKLNGFRIELEEITNVISNNKNVRSSYTLLYDKKQICSFVIPKNKNQFNLEELKEYIKEKLPYYMIPAKIIQLSKFPSNKNGKIDHSKLVSLLGKIQSEDKDFKAASTETELRLETIIKNWLNISEINFNNNLFELGGDSLEAIKLSSTIKREFDVDISVKEIFQIKNLAELSNFIDKSNKINTENIERFSYTNNSDFYELSSAQKRIYYATIASDSSLGVYNILGGIKFSKKLDFDKIKNIFEILINRHESFRTFFIIEKGEIHQKIHHHLDIEIEKLDILKKDLNEQIIIFNTNLDLSKAPLFKIKVLYLNNKTILLINTHHIISDGTSMNILLTEFCNLYAGKKLPENKFTYRDYINYEKYFFGSDTFNENKVFWLNEFSGELPTLNLPTSKIRPASFSFKGKKISTTIDKNLTKSINNLSKKLKVTPYMVLLSAYYILLYEYSGQNDIIIGTPIANRDIPEFSNIIGMFVNTLAIRNYISPNQSFNEFLMKTKEKCLECFEHQKYPFNQLVKELKITRDTSRNPIFDTMFSYQSDLMKNITMNDLSIKYYTPDTNITKFDLTFDIVPQINNYLLNIEYCIDLFEEDFIKSLSRHYINILKNIVNNPNIEIKDINMLSITEKRELKKFNVTDLQIPKKNTLINRFNNIVKKYPNSIAIEFNNQKLNYRKLNYLSNYLAKDLINNNISKGDVVGVCLNKSIELIVSIWAILKIGAIYMPMYSKYPNDRLEYMITNSNAKLVITNSVLEKNITLSIPKLILNNISDIHNNYIISNFNQVNYDDNAYLIYTSGSTGKPKGVLIKHSNLVNFVYAFNKYYKNKITSSDIFLSSTNISFDVSIWEIFLPILNGAKLVLYNEEIISDIVNYSNFILSNKITGLYIPPNILNDVYALLHDKHVYIEKLLVGVEAIKKSTLNKYYELNSDMIIVNGYGPTETTICATALNYKKDTSDDDFVSIGKPLYNNNIYILDKNFNIMPIGVPGEIYIAGAGVGNGYINNPTENKKNFIKNTLDKSSKYLYKTGDLGKWNSNGTITFLGRQDNQIKLSGYRIELGEIEKQITKFPYVKKCLTLVKDIGGRPTLISYIISEKKITPSVLLAHIKKQIPFYMIPKYLVQLNEFPITVNGKIDKTQLPIPEINITENYEPPVTEMEKKLCNIWKKLFNMKKISITSNFFELGGDSLTAIKLQTEAWKYGINMNYSNIFTNPTIKELANSNSLNEKIYQIDTTYDYSKFNTILEKNDISNLKKSYSKKAPKNILLLGGTGFLGAHILDTFLTSTKTKIYCLSRKHGTEDTETRFRKILNYYFGDKYNNAFGKRIFILDGDITKEHLGLSLKNYKLLAETVTHVINSAAFVKHFGFYNNFKNINIDGTKHIVEFCKEFKKKLFHISTISVSGMDHQNSTKPEFNFSEKCFFLNQDLNNVYVYTKFEAEKLVLEAINDGLDACIIRLGNILNRKSDGKFQINFSENAFINRLKAILSLKVIPKKLLEHNLEFSPVDETAELIKQIMCSNADFSIYHAYNPNLLNIKTFIEYVNKCGFNIKAVSDEQFSNKIKKFLNDDNKKTEISGLLQYLNKNKEIELNFSTNPTQDFSLQFFRALGYEWPTIDFDYISLFLKFFNDIDYIK